MALSYAQAPSTAVAEQPLDEAGPVITFETDVFNFGTITQGERREQVFTYTNTGTQPLIIFNVQTTCGCTAPSWTKDPILPGQTGEVKLVFNSTGKKGVITRTVNVQTNSITRASYPLRVKGTVQVP